MSQSPEGRQEEAFRELLLVEVAYRAKGGDKPTSGEYLKRFPNYAGIVHGVFETADTDAESQTVGETTEIQLLNDDRRESDAPRREQDVNDFPAIPGYEVVDILGTGGMGIVYQARQVALDRVVALKMLRTGRHADEQELGRFRTEAEAVAQLQHPHIVQVFEVGDWEGQPYFSLEFVDGGHLGQRVEGAPQQPRDAAKLVETLARAIQQAHDRDIIHRDLKPANILLTSDGTPKITDFGLAKRLESDGHTQTGMVLGTPSYMAPEQAAGEAKTIGRAADIYALGAILYCLLTGRPPFRAATVWDTVDQVLYDDPVPPSQLQPTVPRDLETICLKCLEKELSRRYASAEALAADLNRFVEGKPVQARPVRPWQRAAKWARRRPAVAGLLAVSCVAALAVVGLIVGLYYSGRLETALDEAKKQRGEAVTQRLEADKQRIEADKQRGRAKEQEQLARGLLYLAEMKVAQRAWQEFNVPRMLELLESHRLAKDDSSQDRRGFEWFYLRRLPLNHQHTLQHDNLVNGVAFDANEKWLATVGRDGRVRVWDTATGKLLCTLETRAAQASGVTFSPIDRRLAFTGHDGKIHIADAATGTEARAFAVHDKVVYHAEVRYAAVFSPDGKRLVTSGQAPVRIWEASTGKLILDLKARAYHAVYSPDGRWLAGSWREGNLVGGNTGVKVWDAETGKLARTINGHQFSVYGIAFSPDSKQLATSGRDGTVKVWDVATGDLRLTYFGHTGPVRTVAFHPGGQWVASAGLGKLVKVWDRHSGLDVLELRGNAMPIQSKNPYNFFLPVISEIAFAADGQRLAAAAWDTTVNVWEFRDQEMLHYQLADARDNKRLADRAKAENWHDVRGIETLDAATKSDLWRRFFASAFSPDGRWYAATGGKSTIERFRRKLAIWNAQTGEQSFSLDHSRTTASGFTPDSKHLISVGQGRIRIWDVTTGKRLHDLAAGHKLRVLCLAISPDGKLLATGGEDWTVRLWDLRAGKHVRTLKGHQWGVRSVAFSPDGKLIASASGDKTAKLWDATTGALRFTLKRHSDGLRSVAFSNDAHRLVSGGDDGRVVLWDTRSGQEALTLVGHTQGVGAVAFGANGHWIISSGSDGIRLWDGRPVGSKIP